MNEISVILPPKGLESFKERDIQWAWMFLNLQYTYPQTPYASFLDKRNIIFFHINKIENQDAYIQLILANKQKSLIENRYTDWIDKSDSRLILFLLFFLSFKFSINIQKTNQTTLFDIFLFNLDIWNIDIDSKINFTNQLQTEWNTYKTLNNEIKWINKNNTDQIEWACNYLNKHYKTSPILCNPLINIDKYNSTIHAFDAMSITSHPAEKKLFIDKMKKTWSQKKFRDSGKAKKPYHLPLTKISHNQLDFLSKQMNKPITQVLEFIIDKTHQEFIKDQNGENKKF
ncbi:hypothetical protein [Acinetobacter beijerinckii]|uniref:hypothetical protein n=1 Tax=Acinetobacter beijerinckii TaxID=262668 RepID=UPI003015A31B